MTGPRQALARLERATAEGQLDDLCDRLEVRVLGAFGSATRAARDGDPEPDDLDIAVGFRGPPRELDLLDGLTRLTGTDGIDLLVLDGAEPVARSEGLVGVPLYEDERGRFAIEQMAALAERRDTAHLRELDLRTLRR